MGLRIGVAHHLGWAVVVTASTAHEVVDRRRIELVEPDVQAAPVHHVGGPHAMHQSGAPLDDEELAALVKEVRASAARASVIGLDQLAAVLSEPIDSISVRAWPEDFPSDIATQRRVPYESRADSVMYCQVLTEVAGDRGWDVHQYDAKDVEDRAAHLLGDQAKAILHGPRTTLGPPWTKDHRMALAATILIGTA